jgi:hypothetical protein
MAKKMLYILYWTIFQKNSFLFQNWIAIEALDKANWSNGRWMMLVTVIIFTSVVPLQFIQLKHLEINLFFGKILGLR